MQTLDPLLSFATPHAVMANESKMGQGPSRSADVVGEHNNIPKIRIQDIASLTDFHRNSTAHCQRLKQSGRPVVLRVNGKAVPIVQDATAYQRLLEAVEHANSRHRKDGKGERPPG